jgi:hypothetical protein
MLTQEFYRQLELFFSSVYQQPSVYPTIPVSQQLTPKLEPGSSHRQDDLTLKTEEQFTCQWSNCSEVHHQIGDLVEHINKEHLEKEGRRDLVCFWQGCSRGKKPFKVNIFWQVLLSYNPNLNCLSTTSGSVHAANSYEKPQRRETMRMSVSRMW